MHFPLLAMTTLSAAFGNVNATRTTNIGDTRIPQLNVTYAEEANQITAETLKHVDVFANGGGESWDEAKSFAPALRGFVHNGAQVSSTNDNVIQVDWSFSTGSEKGTTDQKRWLYFQDGTAFDLADGSPAKVLGRYSSNGDVAAILNSYGRGWVGNVGVHVEVDQSWYDDAKPPFKNPEGVKFDVGIDFVRAVMEAA